MNSRSVESEDGSRSTPADRRFALGDQSTCWTLIRQLETSDPDRAREALGELLVRYRGILIRYLSGPPWRFHPDDAADLVQGFLQNRFLEGQLLRRADPARGHFRGLLRVSIDNFARDHLRRMARKPRAFGATDDIGSRINEAVATPDPEPFDIAWARELVHGAINKTRDWCLDHDKNRIWAVFEARLLEPLTSVEPPVAYEQLAREQSFSTPKEAANALITAKRVFRRMFDELIADYLDPDDSIENEIEFIRNVFAQGISLADTPVGRSIPAELNSADETSDSLTQASWLLVRALELPDHDAFWTSEELAPQFLKLLTTPIDELTRSSVTAGKLTFSGTLEELLDSPAPPPEILAEVKTWTKQMLTDDGNPWPPEIISAVYFATIAAARQKLGVALGTLPDAALAESIDQLLQRNWLSESVRDLLAGFHRFSRG